MERFIVSARKYRPQTFDTVIGQQHITTTLKNAIKHQQLAHAFLFCGPRGVGKTTCARILAKTINCELQKDGEACNQCHSCTSFNEGTSLNIHELDAASNNSVDDIRSLVEQVRFAPQAGKYKVYIIDEVHMLSSAAFNAFLKTLEEPPPYAIFILATTEKHKIIPTILSRCQIFDFKRITLQDTVEHLEAIAKNENIKTDQEALQLIAQKSEGCMRDALSILDKITSFTNSNVTYGNTIEHLNILDADYYFKLIDCMLQQDLSGAMLLYDDIDKKGFEGDMVLNGFAEFIRNLLISKDVRVVVLLEVVESFKKRYADTAKKTEAGYLISALNILNEAEINYKQSRNKRLHVELTLIRLCYLQQALQLTAEGNNLTKKKLTDEVKPIAFKTIQPIAVKPQKAEVKKSNGITEAKLIIETPAEKVKPIEVSEPKLEYTPVENGKGKLSTLQAIRKKVQDNCNDPSAVDHPLEITRLKEAWKKYIEQLRTKRDPAVQSFELSELVITSDSKFEVIVTNNLQQKFLEIEKGKACEYLQKELCNKQLQFIIVLKGDQNIDKPDIPLSTKEKYLKIIEEYPLVKELKDRLRLELDY